MHQRYLSEGASDYFSHLVTLLSLDVDFLSVLGVCFLIKPKIFTVEIIYVLDFISVKRLYFFIFKLLSSPRVQ